MPANTPHASYLEKTSEWAAVRDCIAGQRKIKASGEAYVFKLSGQTPDEFAKYVGRGVFFNATDRTHQAMLGLLFRKPPNMEGLDKVTELKAIIADADMKGNSFVSYARQVMSDVCSVGRGGTLIEYSASEKRPYCAYYAPESILNWRVARINGRMILEMIVLEETIERIATDEYAPSNVKQWRVYKVTPNGVTAELWESVMVDQKATKMEQVQAPLPLKRLGKPLTVIPFVFHGAQDNGPQINDVTLADVACINISHFQTSVDLEHGRHLTGLPTPWAAGWTLTKGATLQIGSGAAWVTSEKDAKCGYLEFTGQGLQALTDAIKEKQEQMAALGARLIEPAKKDAEAFDTVALRASAESSTMARIGQCGTESLTQVLAWVRFWESSIATVQEAADGIVFQLNKDFVSAGITSDMLRELVASWQQGAISQETLFYNLARGEMYAEGTKYEEEKDRITENPPMPPAVPGGAPTPGSAGA